MTSQTKTFIELGDMISFRFRCKSEKCGAELHIPLQSDFTMMRPANECPNCHRGWALLNEGVGKLAPTLDTFVESVRKIAGWPGQCEIALEIKG